MTEETFESVIEERNELKKFIKEKQRDEEEKLKIGDILTTAFLGFAFMCVVDYLRHISITGLQYSIDTGGVDQMTGTVYIGMVSLSVWFLWIFGLFWFIGRVNDIFGEYYPDILRRVKESFGTLLKKKDEKDMF